MSGAGLSPKTIDNYAGLVKMAVASAVDAEGGRDFSSQVESRVHRHAGCGEVKAEHALLLRGCDDGAGRLEEAA